MKQINEYRATNKFCIGGVHLRHLSIIHQWAMGLNFSVIAAANSAEAEYGDYEFYTVRVMDNKNRSLGLYDMRLEVTVSDSVKVLETVTICQPTRG